jgi:hypothetical protein
MSAVPKKKLCWNCEGNVSREIDNCPYCGVYLHAAELEENSSWNPSYHSKKEEIPSPLYQIQQEPEIDEQERSIEDVPGNIDEISNWSIILSQLKEDLFPILFLMMGSIFFLFGVVLILFSQNGTLTLQWQGQDGIYFLLFAIPLIIFGWKFLQQLETND